jgi:hypothetical protein
MSTNTILATTPLVSTNYLLRATGTTIGNSLIFDNGTNVGIGNTNTSYTLDVSGTGRFTGALTYPKFIMSGGSDQSELTNAVNNDFKLTNSGNFRIINNSNTVALLTVTNAGAATFSSSITMLGDNLVLNGTNTAIVFQNAGSIKAYNAIVTSTGAYVPGSIINDIIYRSNGNNFLWSVDSGSSCAMKITSGGSIIVPNTGGSLTDCWSANPNSSGVAISSRVSGTGGSDHYYFLNPNGVVGSIQTNGSITTYNVTSDYRLKQDLKDYSGLDLVSAIKTYDYEWKSDNTRMYGVLAHELSQILPYAVSGQKDEIAQDGSPKMQGVDYSKLVPILVKAIQEMNTKSEEQQALITSLQAQINELKNK